MNKKNKIKYLKDYELSDFEIPKTELSIILNPKKTIVFSKLLIKKVSNKNIDLVLDGNKLKLRNIFIDEKKISLKKLKINDEKLIIPYKVFLKDQFILELETEINPKENTELEGLYISRDIFCTQCEAEGFRRITYFLDRPDVLSIFKVKIIGNYKFMLSNGNIIDKGENFIEWFDPWPKPSYLFALVAGNLEVYEDSFTTKSKKKVQLKIFLQNDNRKYCHYAMESLKKSMKWDEEKYDLEYDLNNFMIVAIDDFNMGAMENKGLNIFNSKYILADEKFSTDEDLKSIERIIAHEYFHNWTGNRVTCKNWFQLSLKEGLTVFRDQQFSSEQKDSHVQRINDVKFLRSKQFREDAGPLSHPVRPKEYIEINNFYTTTVYEKGAELIRMMETIYGEKKFLENIKKFLKFFDGKACTIEDLINFFKEESKQFILWYDQPGTPELKIKEKFINGEYSIKFEQSKPKNVKKDFKFPQIPIKYKLFNKNGKPITSEKLFVLYKKNEIIQFEKFKHKPVLSVLRSFSAPVKLNFNISTTDKKILIRHDTDLFNRWEQLQTLLFKNLKAYMYGKQIDNEVFFIINDLLFDDNISDEFKALVITLPSDNEFISYLSEKNILSNPNLIYKSKRKFYFSLTSFLDDKIEELIEYKMKKYTNSFTKINIQNRKLRIKLTELLMYKNPSNKYQYEFLNISSNFTEKISALSMLIEHNTSIEEAKKIFLEWKKDDILLNKWYSIIGSKSLPDDASKIVEEFSNKKNFNWKNPNQFRSLIASFAYNNLAGFHNIDGSGYDLVISWILKMDSHNPQIAASLCTCFDNWKNFDKTIQDQIMSKSSRLKEYGKLSKNSKEIINKIFIN